MKMRIHALAALAAYLLAGHTFAQTSFPEVEPNSLKSEATVVSGIVAGDTIDGTSTGSLSTLGSTLATTADMFRVKTSALSLGIYRHRLTLTTTGTAAHTGTIRGVTQTGTAGTGSTGGTRTTIDATIQTSSTTTTPARFVQWYGFGKQEEIYYRVTGSTSTTAPYVATMSTTPVAPTVIATPIESANPITITTIGLTAVDTELHVFDSNLDAIPGFINDDEGPNGPTLQSRLTRSFPAGTYYVAVSSNNTCWDSVAPPDEDSVTSTLMDFPGSLVTSSTVVTTKDWDFAIIGTNGIFLIPNQVAANDPFGITWFQFTTMAGAPITNDNCANATDISPFVSPGGVASAILDMGPATNDGVASCDPGGLASKDMWFKYTNPTGVVRLLSGNTCSSSFDTVVTVFDSCGGTELACNDDCGGSPCGGPSSCIAPLSINPGQTVLVRVSDKGTGGGLFAITAIVGAPVPANDNCATPIVLAGPGTYTFDTTSATTGTQGQGSTVACATTGSVKKDLWYTYVSSTGGMITLSTCGGVDPLSSSQDTKVVVYNGTGCPAAATGFACQDDAGATLCPGTTTNSVLTFPATCGAAYTFQLGNFSATANIFGTFTITEAAPLCNTPFTPYCSGDGSDATCPCANPGLAGRGCENTSTTGGALLTASGVASVATPTLVLNSTFAVAFGPGLYYEGDAPANAVVPFGIPFGNGLRCAGGATNRLEIRFADAAGAANSTVNLQAFGAAAAGVTYYYQQWYRDTGNVGSCAPGAGFNLSNALSLTWVP